ncbi:MAG: hypothetical protein OXD01_05100 [Gammaproteobacteria bacterium]|nr:hypothetical protein [Gammaproteobacteria bacterium]
MSNVDMRNNELRINRIDYNKFSVEWTADNPLKHWLREHVWGKVPHKIFRERGSLPGDIFPCVIGSRYVPGIKDLAEGRLMVTEIETAGLDLVEVKV